MNRKSERERKMAVGRRARSVEGRKKHTHTKRERERERERVDAELYRSLLSSIRDVTMCTPPAVV